MSVVLYGKQKKHEATQIYVLPCKTSPHGWEVWQVSQDMPSSNRFILALFAFLSWEALFRTSGIWQWIICRTLAGEIIPK